VGRARDRRGVPSHSFVLITDGLRALFDDHRPLGADTDRDGLDVSNRQVRPVLDAGRRCPKVTPFASAAPRCLDHAVKHEHVLDLDSGRYEARPEAHLRRRRGSAGTRLGRRAVRCAASPARRSLQKLTNGTPRGATREIVPLQRPQHSEFAPRQPGREVSMTVPAAPFRRGQRGVTRSPPRT
jgi:hypothetical protein